MVELHWSADLHRHLAGLASVRGSYQSEFGDGGAATDAGPIIVNFFASWCPPCGPEAAALGDLAQIWQPRGARFLSINLFENFGGQENPDRLKRFLTRYDAAFPVVSGTDETAELFGGVDRIPTVFVFRPDGSTAFVFVHEQGATVMHAEYDALNDAISQAMETP